MVVMVIIAPLPTLADYRTCLPGHINTSTCLSILFFLSTTLPPFSKTHLCGIHVWRARFSSKKSISWMLDGNSTQLFLPLKVWSLLLMICLLQFATQSKTPQASCMVLFIQKANINRAGLSRVFTENEHPTERWWPEKSCRTGHERRCRRNRRYNLTSFRLYKCLLLIPGTYFLYSALVLYFPKLRRKVEMSGAFFRFSQEPLAWFRCGHSEHVCCCHK